MNKKLFGSDSIIINNLFTFRKSDINGIYSKHHRSSNNGYQSMKLFIIINGGVSIEIDSSSYTNSKYDSTSKEEQLKEYHKKWEEKII